MKLRPIGTTDISVTPVALGCWPIAGITSINVTEANSVATIQAALDAGINFFDTAFNYGFDGESESMVGRVLRPHRDRVVIATKGGLTWDRHRQRLHDARPESLIRNCHISLDRLGLDCVDLYYLHAPDPQISIEESADAIRQLRNEGCLRAVGVSNCRLDQLQRFHSVCPLDAYQPHYNMLQREIEEAELPWCVEHCVSVMVYWPLMKGLLAGKLARDHVFDERDGRRKYPMFQGDEWNRNQDFIDQLRSIAKDCGRSVADVVINWTIHRPGITATLCGAKRPEQITETAQALSWQLDPALTARIDQAIRDRGAIVSRAAV